MRRIEYSYILDINKIFDVYKKIRSNTKHKKKIVKYELYLGMNLNNILDILTNKSYMHSNYNIFTIHEPKERLIMSELIGDKIVNHLVSNYFLLPFLEPKLIDSNVATRKNKGSGYAIKLMKKYITNLKFKCNIIYVLKCDISKYFYNIDHNILKGMLKKDISNQDILNIIFEIIDSTNKNGIYEYD